MRTDPWTIIGLILAILMGAYNTYMQARASGELDSVRQELIPKLDLNSLLPRDYWTWENEVAFTEAVVWEETNALSFPGANCGL